MPDFLTMFHDGYLMIYGNFHIHIKIIEEHRLTFHIIQLKQEEAHFLLRTKTVVKIEVHMHNEVQKKISQINKFKFIKTSQN